MRALLQLAWRLAPTPNALLITGERGTGKTWLARRVHEMSGRTGRLVEESVAGLQPGLELTELVGHVKEAFTGATSNRPGLIEEAHRGTLFLDEIGDASVALQRMLLTLLERGAIRGVRGLRGVPVDVRFLTATNADLEQLVRQGKFRADLRDRFGYFVLPMPRLADRREDIIPLAEEFLAEFAKRDKWPGPPQLSQEVKDLFYAAPWPGNVRALRLACAFAMTFASPGHPLGLKELPPEFLALVDRRPGGAMTSSKHREARAALARAGGNKSEAARQLGISRPRLYRMLDSGTDATG